MGGTWPDPGAEDYDPFADIYGFDPVPCGHCGRTIRWSFRHRLTGLKGERYCCERCFYEGRKASRRVERQAKSCEVCGELFTPKRSDAKTCSDAHRKALSRSKASKGVTASGVAPEARAAADTSNRDSEE